MCLHTELSIELYETNNLVLNLLNRTLGNSNLNIFWQYFIISKSVVLNNFVKKSIYNEAFSTSLYSSFVVTMRHQWRRQDLLRGMAKMEIMSWSTHGGLQGLVQQLLDD